MIRLKKIIVLMSVLVLFGNIIAQTETNEADEIIGAWLMPDDEGILEIFKENNLYHGKIIWMKKTEEDGSPLKDKKNPDKNLRNREVVGLQVMNNFEYEGDKVWSGGTFYAARKGKKVKPDFILASKDQLNIKISILFFSKTIQLARIDTAEYFKKMKITTNEYKD